MIKTFTAGADIKAMQLVYDVVEDADSSEPTTFVYPVDAGQTPAGIALSAAKRWEQVRVMQRGMIQGSFTAIAGEKITPGFVYLGKDGKLYNSHTREEMITRYVMAGADIKRGQRVVFSHEHGGYVPAADLYAAEGVAKTDASKGSLFEMIVARYDRDTDTISPIDMPPSE